jgi:hypothetical protein
MPLLEFKCSNEHVTEEFFKTISAGERAEWVVCPQCGERSSKIFSTPLGFGLYGDPAGYDKPSATKRHSTKTVSKLSGNDSAVG